MSWVALLLLFTGAAAAGCDAEFVGPAEPVGSNAPGGHRMLRWREPSGGRSHVVRIDGDIEEAFPARLWEGEPSTVAVTGPAPGGDQYRVLVFDAGGRRAAEWRPRSDNPYGFRQVQYPAASTVRVHHHAGGAFLTVSTAGLFFPASLVILDAVAERRLVERMEIWNPGVFLSHAVDGDLVAFAAVNNRLVAVDGGAATRGHGATYGVAIGIVDLPAPRTSATSGGPVVVESPSGLEAAGRGYRHYLLLPVVDRIGTIQSPTIEMYDGVVTVAFTSGLRLRVDPTTGGRTFSCTDGYRLAMNLDPGSEEKHLRALEAGIVAWRGAVDR